MTVHTLDLHFQDTPGLIAAYVIESEDQLALIETGPGSTLQTLRAGIRGLGLDETKIRHVFVTHIHLDHAGAAGWWAQKGAQVYCHPRAAQHLINPTRLLDSARQVYADKMDALWGDTLPAPAERVTILQDGESVTVGAVAITAWDTPGHARHHHAFVIGDVCFTGDVAGMRLAGTDYLSVTAAPPQFELQPYIASVDRVSAAGFRKLYLTHFGEVADPAAYLMAYRQRLETVHRAVLQDHEAGLTADEIRAAYQNREHSLAKTQGISVADWQRLERSNATAMCAD
ncbi:MAG: MBL fold metallo-hydrolase [Verrucomicrobia bacterium]|nr:MBL fold metallo-hydrolase [Verrucomicrobiota bacterium]